MRLGQQLRLRFAEAHRLAAAALHLAHDEQPDAENEQHREPGEQRTEQRKLLARRLGDDLDVLLPKLVDIGRVLRSVGLERRAVVQNARDLLVLDGHFPDAALADFLQEGRERDVVRPPALAGALEQLEQGDQQERDDHPQSEVAEIGVHVIPSVPDKAHSGGGRSTDPVVSHVGVKIGLPGAKAKMKTVFNRQKLEEW